MKKKSKRYKKLIESVKDKKIDTIDTIIGTLKNNANAKFLESIDLSFKINLKKIKTADSSLRSVIELPHGNGKKIKIAVLCDENKLNDAKKSGAEVIGSEDLLKKISFFFFSLLIINFKYFILIKTLFLLKIDH